MRVPHVSQLLQPLHEENRPLAPAPAPRYKTVMSKAWSDKSEYHNLSIELSNLEGQALEQRILPLLRVLWPQVLRAPSSLSALGICFLAEGEETSFELVVQCRGFPRFDLGPDEIATCTDAIHRFRQSGLRARTYLLLHNRDARSHEFRTAIGEALAGLCASDQADRAELWSRQQFLREVFGAMLERVRSAIGTKNLSIKSARAEVEPISYDPLEQVPLQVSELLIDPYRLLSGTTAPPRLSDPALELFGENNLSVLIGEAGFGKTTAALRTFAAGARSILYVPGAVISPTFTTKALLLQCVDLDGLLGPSLDEEDRRVIELIARPTFEHILKEKETPAALIIDGLDESVFLSRRGGIQMLLNLLHDVSVPVVLMARAEFWHARQADFSTLFGITGKSQDRRKRLRLIELLPWQDAEIGLLAKRFRETLSEPAEMERIDHLIGCIDRGSYRDLYGDIPQRPLFLRFILETVAAHDVHQVGRARLFAEWARMKIIRDSRSGRPPILSEQESGDTTAALAFEAMTLAAGRMAQVQDGALELLPGCPLDDVLAADPRLREIIEPTGLFLNSLLVPSAPRTAGGPLLVRFAHRAYQEFFLARFLRRHPEAFRDATAPASVQQWVEDLDQDSEVPAEKQAAHRVQVPRAGPLINVPAGTKWSDITLYYINGHRLSVRVGGARCRQFMYQDLGMASRQNREPTRQWGILIQICQEGSYTPLGRHDKHADKTQMSALRTALRRVFGLTGDPFHQRDRGGGWRPRFRVVDHGPGEKDPGT